MSEPLSPRNAEIARLRTLTRDRAERVEAGRFVVEGVKLVAEALASPLVVVEVFAEPDWDPPPSIVAALGAADVDLTRVTRRGIERIASTRSPQPVVAEVELPGFGYSVLQDRPEDVAPVAVLVAVDLNDPGNVGTLTRSAVAAGFDALVCLGDTADPYGPKSIRASAGALFDVPVIVDRDAQSGLEQLGALGITRFGTRMTDAEPCDRADLLAATAIVLGSEAHGLGADFNALIDRWLAIPMPGETESLNVAMAGTILTYELGRQRRATTD